MRLSLALGLAAAFAGASPGLAAAPRSRSVVSAPSVVVDASRLRALGLGPIADRIEAEVARDLAGDAGGGRLVVTLTGLSMHSYAGPDNGEGGGGGGRSGGGASNVDFLEGVVTRLGPGGAVLSERRQVVSSPANAGGAWYLPGAEERRMAALARDFAAWVRRGTP